MAVLGVAHRLHHLIRPVDQLPDLVVAFDFFEGDEFWSNDGDGFHVLNRLRRQVAGYSVLRSSISSKVPSQDRMPTRSWCGFRSGMGLVSITPVERMSLP